MGSSPHPDINLLAAYAEGSLEAAARRSLEAHLSACAGCRELAVCSRLAWGARAGMEHMRHLPARLRWRAPLAVAASAILVAAAAWSLLPANALHQPTVAAARTASAVKPLPPAAAPAPVRPHRTTRVQAAVAAPVRWARLSSPPPALSAASVPPPPAALDPELNFASLRSGFREQASPPREPSRLVDWGGVTEAAAPVPGTARVARILAPVSVSSLQTALPPLSATTAWPLASGFAGGATASVPAPNSPQLAAELGWAISRGGALLKAATVGLWRAVPFVPGVRVQVIYVHAGHVWASGDANELFTSTDRGKHWQRVQLPGLPARPLLLRSIAFLDSQHGLITAQNGQSWTTSDGGVTWVPR